jgi:hypothetical protein
MQFHGIAPIIARGGIKEKARRVHEPHRSADCQVACNQQLNVVLVRPGQLAEVVEHEEREVFSTHALDRSRQCGEDFVFANQREHFYEEFEGRQSLAAGPFPALPAQSAELRIRGDSVRQKTKLKKHHQR